MKRMNANDIDFEKKPIRSVWKRECINPEVVRCKDCKWYDERTQTAKCVSVLMVTGGEIR